MKLLWYFWEEKIKKTIVGSSFSFSPMLCLFPFSYMIRFSLLILRVSTMWATNSVPVLVTSGWKTVLKVYLKSRNWCLCNCTEITLGTRQHLQGNCFAVG